MKVWCTNIKNWGFAKKHGTLYLLDPLYWYTDNTYIHTPPKTVVVCYVFVWWFEEIVLNGVELFRRVPNGRHTER